MQPTIEPKPQHIIRVGQVWVYHGRSGKRPARPPESLSCKYIIAKIENGIVYGHYYDGDVKATWLNELTLNNKLYDQSESYHAWGRFIKPRSCCTKCSPTV